MCPVGYYCWAGISEPQACSNGTYCPTPGRSTDGDPCLSGYYCSTPLTQTPCTSNHYCPTGSMTPIQCSSCPPGKPKVVSQCTAVQDTVCGVGTNDKDKGDDGTNWVWILIIIVVLMFAVLGVSLIVKYQAMKARSSRHYGAVEEDDSEGTAYVQFEDAGELELR